jgi:O-succinylhomoserine sulfhydrylase
MNEKQQHLQTRLIRTRALQSAQREQITPLYMNSGFNFANAQMARDVYAGEEAGYVYGRWQTPNIDELISRMCVLEAAEDGLTAASGMAAIFTALAGLLNSGDHVVSARALFGATSQVLTQILPRWGISHSTFDGTDPGSWAAAFQANTRVCMVETPSNPALALVDLAQLAALCRERDVVLVVDNTFATPAVQRPLTLGAHLVVHSTTKFLDGQGRSMGGIIAGEQALIDELRSFVRTTGPVMSPFNAWLLNQALELLPLRMERHSANALALARWLDDRPATEIKQVRYPYLPSHPQHDLALHQMAAGGGIVTFEVSGGVERGRRFLDALDLCDIVANLGDARSIATHPASTTHSRLTEQERLAMGITEGLVRISVGLEHQDDIMADVAQALARSS